MSRRRTSNTRKKSSKEALRSRLKESATQNKLRRSRKGPGKSKPLWRLEDGITYSALTRWLECREQFSLSYIDGLTPKKISVPLEFGSIFHLCCEHQFTNPNHSPIQVAKQITKGYKQLRSKSLLSTADKDSLEGIIQLIEATFPAYCNHWAADDEAIQWVKREEKFAVKYTIHTETGPVTVLLRGMRDGIIRVYKKLGLFETKTKSRINESDIRDGLKADMQTMFYLHATYLEKKEMPETVLYNVIRRSSMYRKKDESIKSYVERIKKDISIRPDYYFMRWEVTVTKTDLNNFVKKTLDPILIQFINWYNSVKKNPTDRFQSPFHFLNSNALFNKYGRSDMFTAIHGNYRPYRVRSVPFPELEESFVVN